MKRLLCPIIAAFLITFSSCDLIDEVTEGDNEIGGETSIPMNQVGNTFDGAVYMNGEYIDMPHTATITSTKDGVVGLQLNADLTKSSVLNQFGNFIPSTYKDAEGRVNANLKFKITSEGVLDYVNADGKPHTMVKYDCKVGDTYTLKKSDGTSIFREVTAKSSEDDFSWGWLLIKTITVEETSRIPGISKIEYRFNHKFGLVHIEVTAEDGSKISSPIFTANY